MPRVYFSSTDDLLCQVDPIQYARTVVVMTTQPASIARLSRVQNPAPNSKTGTDYKLEFVILSSRDDAKAHNTI